MSVALVGKRMCEEEVEQGLDALKRLARAEAHLAHAQIGDLVGFDLLPLHHRHRIIARRALGPAQDE